MLWKWTFWKRL